jgi:hypothetical protein
MHVVSMQGRDRSAPAPIQYGSQRHFRKWLLRLGPYASVYPAAVDPPK